MESHTIAKNILSIECAVAKGSVAVIREGVVAAAADSLANASRAEEILLVIRDSLDRAGLDLREIDLLAVSAGPGSYSGIRIGMATAAGLSDALSVRTAGFSVLDAMASGAGLEGKIVTAVPVGKRDVAHCLFEVTANDATHVSEAVLESESDFIASLSQAGGKHVFCHAELLSRLTGKLPDDILLIDAGTNLAQFVGLFAGRNQEIAAMRPIYLRNQKLAKDAAGF